MLIMLKRLGIFLFAVLLSVGASFPGAAAQTYGSPSGVWGSDPYDTGSSRNRYGFEDSAPREDTQSRQDTQQPVQQPQQTLTPPAPAYEQVNTSAAWQRKQRSDWGDQAQASQTYGTPPSAQPAPATSDPYSLGGSYVPPPANATVYNGGSQRIDAQPTSQQPQQTYQQPQQTYQQPAYQSQPQQPAYQPQQQVQPQPQVVYQPQPQQQVQPQPQVVYQPQPRQTAPVQQPAQASKPLAAKPEPQRAATVAQGTTVYNRSNAANEYRLGAGDQMQITVFGHPDLSGPRTVDGSGYIAMPLVDRLSVAGMTPRELELAIVNVLSPDYLRDPRVSVEVMNYRPFFILGEVAKTGRYEYAEGLTVIEAIALAGGFTYRASEKSIKIRRYGATEEQKAEPQTVVLPGDVITVPDRGLF